MIFSPKQFGALHFRDHPLDYRLLIISHLQNYCYSYEVHSPVRLLASFPLGFLPDQEGFNPLVLEKKKKKNKKASQQYWHLLP